MGTSEIFDHTADVGVRVRARDLNDLFETAAQALFDYVVANREMVRTDHVESLDITGESPNDLLLAFLNELIFRSETGHKLYSGFKARVDDQGQSLSAEIAGEPIDRNRHLLDHEVKAVTRHGLAVAQGPTGEWLAEFILDI